MKTLTCSKKDLLKVIEQYSIDGVKITIEYKEFPGNYVVKVIDLHDMPVEPHIEDVPYFNTMHFERDR